jgi:AraC family transcriptional regulator
MNQAMQSLTVTVEQLPAKRVLAVAHRGPYGAISDAFEALDRIVRPSTLLSLPDLEMVAIHHDDPEATPSAELRASAGLVVPFDAAAPDGLHEVIIPAGLYAHVMHVGPYETLGDTWSQLGGWLGSSSYRAGTGVSYERYLNTPMDAAPHELNTVLYLPIVGAS